MSPPLRRVLAVLAGVGVGVGIIFAVEAINSWLYVPPGLDLNDLDAMRAYMRELPAAALLIVLLGWGLGALAGGWVAARVGRGFAPARWVGIILLGVALFNLLSLPHPLWFWIVGILVFVPAAELGARLAGASPDFAG